MAARVGDQVGSYLLLHELGSGTCGTVYQARHVLLRTRVALKVLHGSITEAERLALRGEARRQAALEHPNIVQVLAYAEQPVPHLVMKFAPNGTLAQRYPLGQRQKLSAILPHVCQIAEGLQHAHNQLTLHLDLKPANVLLGRQDEALISDFGISLILQQHKTHQTIAQFAGTPAYMAPEHLEQKPGMASDQYALATMIYQWLTGMLPFTGDIWSMGLQKLTRDPPPLRQHVPDLLPAVEQVVLKALARDPKARYETVQAFAAALEQAWQRGGLLFAPTQVMLSSTAGASAGAPAMPPVLAPSVPTRQSIAPQTVDASWRQPSPISHHPSSLADHSSITEFQHSLRGIHYPATREQLLAQARANNAPPNMIMRLEELDPNHQFINPRDVMIGYANHRFLNGVWYPATSDQLLEYAHDNKVKGKLVTWLEGLGQPVTFASLTEVVRSYSAHHLAEEDEEE